MHCLWITRQDPRSADSGDLIYTLGLLRSTAAAGELRVTVLAHRGKPSTYELAGVSWNLPAAVPAKSPLSLLSRLPSDAHRLGNPAMRAELRRLLGAHHFDAAVIDQAACGWALDLLPESLPVLYIAHNHEAVVRPEIAAGNEGSLPLRLALRRDAGQYAALERRLCRHAATISAITPRDEAAFRREFPDKRYLPLPPGYPPPSEEPAPITADTPRKVVLAGTFEWLAKRRNLEAFLAAAENVFPAADIAFLVVGKADPHYFAALASRHPWATFEANVPSMEPYLSGVRIGLIPEALGGGFKLKALDYIFRGIPLAAVEPALSGLPLDPRSEVIAAGDLDSLATAVVGKIDELDFLNRIAAQALERCRDAFHWNDRGATLATALNELSQP